MAAKQGVNIQNRRPTGVRAKWLGRSLSIILAPFARRFIAGTTLPKALETVARLKEQGFETTVDHLGESVTNPAEATTAAEQYVVVLKALKEVPVMIPYGLPQGILFPFREEVFSSQFQWRKTQLPGHQVDQTLGYEATFRMSVSPVGSDRGGVGINAVGIHMTVFDGIRSHTIMPCHGNDIG